MHTLMVRQGLEPSGHAYIIGQVKHSSHAHTNCDEGLEHSGHGYYEIIKLFLRSGIHKCQIGSFAMRSCSH